MACKWEWEVEVACKWEWEKGVVTYDVSTKETFRLYASILWTINDFLAYENL